MFSCPNQTALCKGNEQEKASSSETTLPAPNMTASNYGPPIRNVHRQNHHFPPLPITPLKIPRPSYNFTAASRLLPGPASPSLLRLATRDIGFTNSRSDRRVAHLDRPRSSMGKAPWISSHEQPSTSFILRSIASSSGVHGTRFFLTCNVVSRTLEYVLAS